MTGWGYCPYNRQYLFYCFPSLRQQGSLLPRSQTETCDPRNPELCVGRCDFHVPKFRVYAKIVTMMPLLKHQRIRRWQLIYKPIKCSLANLRYWPNAGPMLVWRRRRRPRISPTLAKHIDFRNVCERGWFWIDHISTNVGSMLAHRLRRRPNIYQHWQNVLWFLHSVTFASDVAQFMIGLY